ncbi:MAG: HNH endonuclease [Actinomycetota bacterium]|nr:HNH endonuclease [Actinomycetota bacterium]
MGTVVRDSHEGAVPARDRSTQNGHGAGLRRLARGRVLVLNASYEPLNVCSVRRALVLLLKEKAEMLERGDGVLRSETMVIDRPEVIRLVSFVRVPRDIHRRRITRKAVLARDEWMCQYCGSEKPGLTVDHVIPRSRGGESVWENIVAACAACNRRKGNRMPHEVRMHPRNHPRPPGPTVFIRIAAPRTPRAWEAYLLAA